MRGIMNTGSQENERFTTMQDFLAIGFRQRRLMINTFLGILALTILIAILMPRKYESEMKILVRHERADTMVTPDSSPSTPTRTDVSEAELQSEAELLKSSDVLSKVVVACNLQKSEESSLWGQDSGNANQKAISRAAEKLEKDLVIQPIKLTNLIKVTYRAKDPQTAESVLNTLLNLYMEKHLAMHRSPGEFEFFHQQAEQYQKSLANAEAKLADFTRSEGVVNPTLENEITVRKLAEFDAESKAARATVAEIQQRITTLEGQLASLPKRQTTQVRLADNPQLMERMKSTLLDLELKRINLLSKFEPTYRPVQEVEAQIADTRKAIAEAQSAPLRDEITDRDPTYEAVRSELTKAKTDMAAAEARASAIGGLVRAYRQRSQQLETKEVAHQTMVRTAKTSEDNYLLYLRKQEEARISDALDQKRISNVVVAQPATTPLTSHSGRLVIAFVGLILAMFISAGLAFAVDYWDPSFRTPEEVESYLGAPVVAAFPKDSQ